MKRAVLIFIVVMLPLFFSAQTVLMEEYPGNDTIVPKWGKNLSHFIHIYFNYGVYADNFSNDKASSKIPGSSEIGLGLRYKKKITNFYSMGLDFNMNSTGFAIKQKNGKSFPDTIMYKRETINMSTLSLEYYNRINFDRRGNKIGKFLDLGIYGFFNPNSWHFTRMEYDTLSYGNTKTIEVKYFRPDYLNNYGYGVSARLGMNAFVLYARYRLTDLVRSDKYTGYPELPRMTIGIQLSLH